MGYKQKGWSPFTQQPGCFPGGNCKPGGRRTNKWRHRWNRLKANIGEIFEKENTNPTTPPSIWEGFDPKTGREYRTTSKGDTIWKDPVMFVSPNKESK